MHTCMNAGMQAVSTFLSFFLFLLFSSNLTITISSFQSREQCIFESLSRYRTKVNDSRWERCSIGPDRILLITFVNTHLYDVCTEVSYLLLKVLPENNIVIVPTYIFIWSFFVCFAFPVLSRCIIFTSVGTTRGQGIFLTFSFFWRFLKAQILTFWA